MDDDRQSGRTEFRSLRAGGLNWDVLPLRLFDKGNKKFWNPATSTSARTRSTYRR